MEVTVYHFNPQTVYIPHEEMISVEPGDLIGIHYTDTDGLGVVPYEDSNKASTTGFTNDQLSRIFNAELDDSNLPVRVTKTVPGNIAYIKRLPALKPITMIGVYWENYLISCTICTSFAGLCFVMLWNPIGFVGFVIHAMMTSWYGGASRVTGPLWGESIGYQSKRVSYAGFDVFFDISLNKVFE